MRIEEITNFLDSREAAESWLRDCGFRDLPAAHAAIVSLAAAGFTIDLLSNITRQIERILPDVTDPDLALENLVRFVQSARSPISLGALIERDETALPVLLRIFSTSQRLSDLLIEDPDGYDLLRMTDGMPVPRELLLGEFLQESSNVHRRQDLIELLRSCKRRETLRIAYGDLVMGQPVTQTMSQLSYLAEAICAAAFQFAMRELVANRGEPFGNNGQPCHSALIALGALGGTELSYDNQLQLMLVYQSPGRTSGGRKSTDNQQFYEMVAREIQQLLGEVTPLGDCYQVAYTTASHDAQQLSTLVSDAIRFVDLAGSMPLRLALVKARRIAGDEQLGTSFLESMHSWIYRSFLSQAEIAEIKAASRQLQMRLEAHRESMRHSLEAQAGIRDVEFTIQFLQLLHGHETTAIREANTLSAIEQLSRTDCLTVQESTTLHDCYSFLRAVVHLQQIMFADAQQTTLESAQLKKLAETIRYPSLKITDAISLENEIRQRIASHRQILDHLLHRAFPESTAGDPIVDWLNNPSMPQAQVERLLSQLGFVDPAQALQDLTALAYESNPFLSTRRCRHFFGAIARHLIEEIGTTPAPDQTLSMLNQVSASIGGKAMLWELFSFNEASRNMFIRLCASARYLSSILINHPGMVDELMNSLMLDQLPSAERLNNELAILVRDAEQVDLIVHGFKNSHHLSIGIRDMMGKSEINQTHLALADVADCCLQTIAAHEEQILMERHGEPRDQYGNRCELLMLAMGRLGGQEPNYHSDLDVVFLYSHDGQTTGADGTRSISNNQFFTKLSTRISRTVNQTTTGGRLYELDSRLRPSGKSGPPVISLDEFLAYFLSGRGGLEERLSLCKGRLINGSPELCERTMSVVRQAINATPWRPDFAQEVFNNRKALDASPANLKRSMGGTLDIECITQLMQLQHQQTHPQILVPGTLHALDELLRAKLLAPQDVLSLRESYRFLREVESRLRLLNTRARHDLPDDERNLQHLAYLMRLDSADTLLTRCDQYRLLNRELFTRVVKQAQRPA
jgi:glutamate-ammonia-ligase adenylyltransferase